MPYLFRLYKNYWYVCWKVKQADGRWITKAKSLKTKNKIVAKKKFEAIYSDGAEKAKECDFSAWLKQYEYELKNNNQTKLSRLTLVKYQHNVSAFAAFMAGKIVYISQVGRDHVNDFFKMLADKGFSSSSISGYKRSLKKMFRVANILGCIRKNPMENIPIPANKERTRFFSEEEIRKILKAVEGNDYQTALVLYFLLTGFRVSEVTRSSWEYVNHTNKTIQVLGKGNKYRIQRLPTRLYEAITKIRTDEPTIFGKSIKQIERDLKAALNKAGIDGNCHDCRRSYATYSIKILSPDLLRNRMGHSSLQQLDKYTRGFNREIPADIKELFSDWQII